MSDDEPLITTGNPGLAKLSMWLLGLVTTLGTYIWNGTSAKIEKLEAQVSADHDTLIVLQTNSKEITVKLDHVIQILEEQQRGRRR